MVFKEFVLLRVLVQLVPYCATIPANLHVPTFLTPVHINHWFTCRCKSRKKFQLSSGCCGGFFGSSQECCSVATISNWCHPVLPMLFYLRAAFSLSLVTLLFYERRAPVFEVWNVRNFKAIAWVQVKGQTNTNFERKSFCHKKDASVQWKEFLRLGGVEITCITKPIKKSQYHHQQQ